MFFLHVILSYLTASIFRDPMLNCFSTECCSFYFAVISFGSACMQSTVPFRNVLPALSFSLFLKFRSIKSSDKKILGHFNFRTK